MKTVFFTLKELIHTNTGLNNIPSFEQVDNLYNLVINVLDPLRAKYGWPIRVNSGFRSPEVNKAVGGAKNSQHLCLNGSAAADITAGDKDSNKKLFNLIIKLDLPWDQVILENGGEWVHVSYSPQERKQILYLGK
jgi:hypothetical protein